MKTIRDKVRYVMAEQKEVNKNNERNSSSPEEYGLLDQLLDKFIMKVDDAEGSWRRERDEKTTREEGLVEVGEQMEAKTTLSTLERRGKYEWELTIYRKERPCKRHIRWVKGGSAARAQAPKEMERDGT